MLINSRIPPLWCFPLVISFTYCSRLKYNRNITKSLEITYLGIKDIPGTRFPKSGSQRDREIFTIHAVVEVRDLLCFISSTNVEAQTYYIICTFSRPNPVCLFAFCFRCKLRQHLPDSNKDARLLPAQCRKILSPRL